MKIWWVVALAIVTGFLAACAAGGGKESAEVADIGYPTVAEARAALAGRDDVTISEQEGWTLIEDPETGALWNFTPPNHSAHPTVVKRVVVKRPGKDEIEMYGRCEGPDFACEALIRKFEYQNAQLTQSPMRLHQQPSGAAADLPPSGSLLR